MVVGDLVVDVVVRLEEPPEGRPAGLAAGSVVLNLGSDSPAIVTHRQGGSAANVCVAAAGLGAATRFVGQVGDDPIGRWLVESLRAAGVEPAVRAAGRTGSVIVLCHADGERSMITDRGVSADLSEPDPAWLDGVQALHLPLYSLAVDPLRSTALALAARARDRGALVSLDLSSTSLLAALGSPAVARLAAVLAPDVVLANEAEAAWARAAGLALSTALSTAVLVEKRGPAPAMVAVPGRPAVAVPPPRLGPVADSTGAGDAFAAGWLTARLAGADPVEAAGAGHQAAAARLRALGAGA